MAQGSTKNAAWIAKSGRENSRVTFRRTARSESWRGGAAQSASRHFFSLRENKSDATTAMAWVTGKNFACTRVRSEIICAQPAKVAASLCVENCEPRAANALVSIGRAVYADRRMKRQWLWPRSHGCAALAEIFATEVAEVHHSGY